MSSPTEGMEVVIKETYIEEGQLSINGVKLRKFQEELYHSLGKYRRVLLRAPTGSGKTFTLIVSLMKSTENGLPVIGIYPSRALVYDQYESVRATLMKLGFSYDGKDTFTGSFNGGKEVSIKVVRLTSETSKGAYEELSKYIPTPTRLLLLLTVPEYPYMFLSTLGKSAEASRLIELGMKMREPNFREVQRELGSKLTSYNLLNDFAMYFNGFFFIDEFHLYDGIERASLKTLLDMIEFYWGETNTSNTIVFSSATPVDVKVDRVIEANFGLGSKIRKKTKVVFHLVSGNPQEELVNYVLSRNFQGEKKVGIILDRVYYIAELCNKAKWNNVGLLWGLDISYGVCQKKQYIRDSNIVVGNNAISFGIDVPDLDLGFITAHDAETLIQRFGRFGRGGGEGEAEVHIFVESTSKVVNELKAVKGKEINYEEFVELINKIYERRINDKLDELEFSRVRGNAVFNAFLLSYLIANGVQAEGQVKKAWRTVSETINLRPSLEEYFRVFAFRPGGIKARICDKGESEDFFTLVRNFSYRGGCFDLSNTLKEYPYLLVDSLEGIEECKLMPFSDFVRKTRHPSVVLGQNEIVIPESAIMKRLEALKDTYVLLITRKCVDWGSEFSEMVKVVASYASALPVCIGKAKKYCNNPKALLLFV